jgi:hypothetical protein
MSDKYLAAIMIFMALIGGVLIGQHFILSIQMAELIEAVRGLRP